MLNYISKQTSYDVAYEVAQKAKKVLGLSEYDRETLEHDINNLRAHEQIEKGEDWAKGVPAKSIKLVDSVGIDENFKRSRNRTMNVENMSKKQLTEEHTIPVHYGNKIFFILDLMSGDQILSFIRQYRIYEDIEISKDEIDISNIYSAISKYLDKDSGKAFYHWLDEYCYSEGIFDYYVLAYHNGDKYIYYTDNSKKPFTDNLNDNNIRTYKDKNDAERELKYFSSPDELFRRMNNYQIATDIKIKPAKNNLFVVTGKDINTGDTYYFWDDDTYFDWSKSLIDKYLMSKEEADKRLIDAKEDPILSFDELFKPVNVRDIISDTPLEESKQSKEKDIPADKVDESLNSRWKKMFGEPYKDSMSKATPQQLDDLKKRLLGTEKGKDAKQTSKEIAHESYSMQESTLTEDSDALADQKKKFAEYQEKLNEVNKKIEELLDKKRKYDSAKPEEKKQMDMIGVMDSVSSQLADYEQKQKHYMKEMELLDKQIKNNGENENPKVEDPKETGYGLAIFQNGKYVQGKVYKNSDEVNAVVNKVYKTKTGSGSLILVGIRPDKTLGTTIELKLGSHPSFNEIKKIQLPNDIKSQMNQVAKDLGFGGLKESLDQTREKALKMKESSNAFAILYGYRTKDGKEVELEPEELKEDMESNKKLMLVWEHFNPSNINLIYDNDFSRLESYMSTEDDIICEDEGAVESGIFLLAHNDESEMLSFVGHSIEDVKTKFIQAVEQAKVEAQEYEDEDLNLGDPFYYCTDNLNLSSEEMFNEWISWITSSQVDGDSGYAWHLIDVANKQVLYGSEESEVIFYDSVDEYFNDLTGGLDNTEGEELEENTITNTLPPVIDQFLMDCAQMYCNFDYTDISKFGERATEDEIKLLRKIRADLKDGFDEDDPEVKDIFNEIEKIVKGTGLTEAIGYDYFGNPIEVKDWAKDYVVKKKIVWEDASDNDETFDIDEMKTTSLYNESTDSIIIPVGTKLEYQGLDKNGQTGVAVYSLPQYNNVEIRIYFDYWRYEFSEYVSSPMSDEEKRQRADAAARNKAERELKDSRAMWCIASDSYTNYGYRINNGSMWSHQGKDYLYVRGVNKASGALKTKITSNNTNFKFRVAFKDLNKAEAYCKQLDDKYHVERIQDRLLTQYTWVEAKDELGNDIYVTQEAKSYYDAMVSKATPEHKKLGSMNDLDDSTKKALEQAVIKETEDFSKERDEVYSLYVNGKYTNYKLDLDAPKKAYIRKFLQQNGYETWTVYGYLSYRKITSKDTVIERYAYYEDEVRDNSQNQVVESVLMEKDPNLTDSQKKYVEDMYNKDMEFYGFASYDSEDDFVEDVTIDFDELEAVEMYKYYKQLHEVNGTDESSNSNIISDLAKELRVNGPRSRGDRKPEPIPGCINEINIPDEMRYKEYDFREENGALYIKWITQGSFTSEDVDIFIDEVASAIDNVAKDLGIFDKFDVIIEVTSRDGKESGYAKETLRFEHVGSDSEQIEEARSNNSLSARLKARLNKLTECNSEDQLTEEKLSTRLIRRLNQGKINEAPIVEEVTDIDLTEESLKWNMGSNKLVSTDSEEFARLVDLAKLLQEKSPNGFMYTVEKTYEDFGAGMQWYNIICHNKKGDRWQVLNTKQWLELANGKLTVEQSYDSIIKDEYFQDKISGDVNTMNHSQLLKFMDSFDEE